jgi:hypothetical protein
MNDMTVGLEHLHQHPERYVSLSEDDICREIIIDDIEMSVVSESLCECPSRSKKYWIYPLKNIQVYFFLS